MYAKHAEFGSDADPFHDARRQPIEPQAAEQLLRDQMPSRQMNWTPEDYVEISWHAPTVWLCVARPMLKGHAKCPGYPAWVANALGGMTSCIDPTNTTASKTVAGTVLDLLTHPDFPVKVRTEFEQQSDGNNYIAPCLTPDFLAPFAQLQQCAGVRESISTFALSVIRRRRLMLLSWTRVSMFPRFRIELRTPRP